MRWGLSDDYKFSIGTVSLNWLHVNLVKLIILSVTSIAYFHFVISYIQIKFDLAENYM